MPMHHDANSQQALQGVLEGLLLEGKTVEVPVFGYSMCPFLKPGVTVRIAPVATDQVKKGDVLFFKRKGRLVLHRVLDRLPNGWLCRGDSLADYDPVVLPQDVCGVLAGWKNRGRWRSVGCGRFKRYRALALYGGGVLPFCARLYVRAAMRFDSFKTK